MTIIMFIIFFLIASACVMPTATPSPTPFPNPREVGSSTLPLREIWRVKSGGINRDTWALSVQGLVYTTQDQAKQLILLDDHTGQIRWQKRYGDQWEGGTATSLVVDKERIYLTELTRLHTYRLSDGQLLWEFDTKKTHRGHYLYIGNNELFEYESTTYDGNIVRQFDPLTGTLLDTKIVSVANLSIRVLTKDIYLGKMGDELLAINRNTDEVLWHTVPTPRGWVEIITPPVMIDNLLVLTNDWDLLVLESETGKILWSKSNIISNPVVLDDFVYVITTDASIKAFNVVNGQEIGQIQMEPPLIPTGKYGRYALQVNPRDKIIYAYYGDSEEIIAFGQ